MGMLLLDLDLEYYPSSSLFSYSCLAFRVIHCMIEMS